VCADDMAALMRRLRFDACVAIGHGPGGRVCYSMPLHSPKILSRLVVLQAAHPATLDRELRHDPEQIASGGHWLALHAKATSKCEEFSNASRSAVNVDKCHLATSRKPLPRSNCRISSGAWSPGSAAAM
jgi:pimeloyl-ACP methyl ester carboxylesterase